MYFTEADIKKVGNYKRTKIFALLEDFKNSGMKCAKLEGWSYASAKTGTNSISESIKRYNFDGIRAVAKRGEIYLVNDNV